MQREVLVSAKRTLSLRSRLWTWWHKDITKFRRRGAPGAIRRQGGEWVWWQITKAVGDDVAECGSRRPRTNWAKWFDSAFVKVHRVEWPNKAKTSRDLWRKEVHKFVRCGIVQRRSGPASLGEVVKCAELGWAGQCGVRGSWLLVGGYCPILDLVLVGLFRFLQWFKLSRVAVSSVAKSSTHVEQNSLKLQTQWNVVFWQKVVSSEGLNVNRRDLIGHASVGRVWRQHPSL